jgi:polyribonucleotide 5'-hydroxyl-kinase
MYVHLDVGQGQLSIPGSVQYSHYNVQRLLWILLILKKPFPKYFRLIFQYGYDEPGSNVMLYMILLVTRLT